MGDHAGLAEAARHGAVLPALVLEPAEIARLAGNPRRAAYYCGAVGSLANDLVAAQTRLVCRRGPLVATVLRLVRERRATAVTWAAAYDVASVRKQQALQSALEEAGVRATIVHDAPAVAPDETAAARAEGGGLGYRALVPYLTVWATQPRPPMTSRISFSSATIATEPLPQPQEFGACALPEELLPAQHRVLSAFSRYLGGDALQYLSARNVPAGTPTSRLSEALAFGVVSARSVLARIDERSRDPFLLSEERVSLRALERAVAQRDFFLQLAWFFENEPDEALQSRMRGFPFATTHPALEAWREGRTGFALVDAGARELLATGWMHPRVRAVSASFLCFDLGVDWRVGRDAWDRELIEDTPALATGNWQWVAGVGADLAQFPRIYNPQKQTRSFDPIGTYVRRWIPELAHASDADIAHLPAASQRQLTLPLFGRTPYPAPVIDHGIAARAFLQRYANFTGRPITPPAPIPADRANR
ncbi:MAG: deoxyribodipyrimidine photo-lyase [Candidatus Eremiobacteraeota bacterium]|nr:deoxyribodipyrimidine photo-lyase [Candidatus Eremiobacteraeota bacterium]